MAWTDQCKMAFCQTADHKINEQKIKGQRVNISKALKDIAKESDIPFKTLYRWYHEIEQSRKARNLKNETTQEPQKKQEDVSNNEQVKQVNNNQPRQLCMRCHNGPVELNTRTGRPYGPESKYYGLCQRCRKKAKLITDAIKIANEEKSGRMVVCPHCHHDFLVPD